jgi:hypothetical protein
MDDLVAFLQARLDEDEQWALAASAPYPYADGEPGVPQAGVRWQWVEGPDWEPTQPDPAVDEFVAEPGMACNLVSVETWPAGGRMMRRRFATEIIELDSAAAGHIARHDPARVLREVEAKRQMLAFHDRAHPHDGDPCTTQRLLVLPYADHPDYRPEWKP